jgi:hypothetical protein
MVNTYFSFKQCNDAYRLQCLTTPNAVMNYLITTASHAIYSTKYQQNCMTLMSFHQFDAITN